MARPFNTPAWVEAESRIADGATQVSLKELDERLRTIGYRLDRKSRRAGIFRYVSGPYEGRTFPKLEYGVIQLSDGQSASHAEARRDANYDLMQSMRDELFALVRGAIQSI